MLLDTVNRLCEKEGITLAQLEKACGIGNGTISKWGNPRIDTLKKVADHFHVTVDDLLNGGKKRK